MIVNAETGAPVDVDGGPGETWWTPRATAAFLATRDDGDGGGGDGANDRGGPTSRSCYARLVQGECAELRAPAPPGAALGSQDATTCAVVALSWPGARVWLAHLDAAPGEADRKSVV